MSLEIVRFLVDNYRLLLIVPMVMGLITEQHFVSRGSVVANTVGMFVAVAPHWDATRFWLGALFGVSIFHTYLVIGLVMGVIAFFSYAFDESAPSEFYWLTFVFYNTAFGVLVCLAATFAV